MKTIAQRSLTLTGLFEADLFVWLLLRNWGHPLAEDEEFRDSLLENAAEALRAATDGQQLIEDLPPDQLNLVAALWYCEQCATDDESVDSPIRQGRSRWLGEVRRALPSCFCNQSDLPPT